MNSYNTQLLYHLSHAWYKDTQTTRCPRRGLLSSGTGTVSTELIRRKQKARWWSVSTCKHLYIFSTFQLVIVSITVCTFYRRRSQGDNTFGSVHPPVRPSVRLFVCALLLKPCDLWPWFLAKEKHHDAWNTVQNLCVFVSNQGTFAIKELRAAIGGF